jgi:hypothetical protein
VWLRTKFNQFANKEFALRTAVTIDFIGMTGNVQRFLTINRVSPYGLPVLVFPFMKHGQFG